MGNPVVHFEVTAPDGQALEKFYAELFGWHVQSMPEMSYGLVDTHSSEGINGGIGTSQEGQRYVTFYVGVDDLQATLDKAESMGAKTVMPIMEVPGVVTMAMFSDPQGNVIGLVRNEPDMENPPKSPGSNPPVSWFEVLGPDGEALRDFYATLFGWRIEVAPEDQFKYGQVDPSETGIGGGIVGSPTGQPMVTVYAKVDDLQSYLDRAESLGGKTVMPPMDVGGTTSVAQFADPAGNVFGIYKSTG